ncbi:MAG: phenazine biosynthesis PhzC/PhzF protein [Ignavibacteria bacterium]|nr:MAG: phenazine biosynthesis PhzC/PhzF protein [Ignavibacteria bacterium]KAF0160103.1 MAG: phenazine biosynthesis PhzC/PhzF protein [Ignavibacteria bacterium]
MKFYQVDAFTSKLFGGNPAAVVPLNKWLDNETMQNIAMENNLSETAYFVKEGTHYHIRWMTPVAEVSLCGHATLASAYVIFNFIETDAVQIKFMSMSGELIVDRDLEMLSLNFPSNKPYKVETTDLIKSLFENPLEVLEGGNYTLIVFDDESYVREVNPNFELVKKIHPHGVIISSKGKYVDFVSRMFAPNQGINEDPVTGSAHTVLIPYWAEKLSKKNFRALQVSKRVGELFCEDLGDRVKISGKAVLYATGNLFLGL